MSGLTNGLFELTATRAKYWHRQRECACASLVEIGKEHLGGFVYELGRGGNFLIVAGSESALFEAISGRVSVWPVGGRSRSPRRWDEAG